MSQEINQRLAARRPGLDTRAELDAVPAGLIRGSFETVKGNCQRSSFGGTLGQTVFDDQQVDILFA